MIFFKERTTKIINVAHHQITWIHSKALLNPSPNVPLMHCLCCHHLFRIISAVCGVAVKAIPVNQCFAETEVRAIQKQKKSKVTGLLVLYIIGYPLSLMRTLEFSILFFYIMRRFIWIEEKRKAQHQTTQYFYSYFLRS